MLYNTSKASRCGVIDLMTHVTIQVTGPWIRLRRQGQCGAQAHLQDVSQLKSPLLRTRCILPMARVPSFIMTLRIGNGSGRSPPAAGAGGDAIQNAQEHSAGRQTQSSPPPPPPLSRTRHARGRPAEHTPPRVLSSHGRPFARLLLISRSFKAKPMQD